MIILVNEVNEKKRRLVKIKEDYYDLLLNYYNQVKNLKFFWKSNKADRFDNLAHEEKIYSYKIVDTISEFSNVFAYIASSYSLFGNKIFFDLNFKTDVINAYNRYISDIEGVISAIDNLDRTDFSSANIYTINSMRNSYSKELTILRTSKSNFIKTVDKINNIENIIRKRLNNIGIPSLKNVYYNKNYYKRSRDMLMSDTIEIDNINEKLRFYKNEESKIFDELDKIKGKIEESYSAYQLDNIIEKIEKINSCISNINIKHVGNIQYLNDEITAINIATKKNISNIDDMI